MEISYIDADHQFVVGDTYRLRLRDQAVKVTPTHVYVGGPMGEMRDLLKTAKGGYFLFDYNGENEYFRDTKELLEFLKQKTAHKYARDFLDQLLVDIEDVMPEL